MPGICQADLARFLQIPNQDKNWITHNILTLMEEGSINKIIRKKNGRNAVFYIDNRENENIISIQPTIELDSSDYEYFTSKESNSENNTSDNSEQNYLGVNNNLTNGLNYEKFVYENLLNDHKDVWLWKDIPSQELDRYNGKITNTKDIGADILVKEGDQHIFIQCKNYKGTIYKNDLSGFYHLIATHRLIGCVYYNGQLSNNIITTEYISYHNLPYDNL